jgi:hypothetical protein
LVTDDEILLHQMMQGVQQQLSGLLTMMSNKFRLPLVLVLKKLPLLLLQITLLLVMSEPLLHCVLLE